jgi:myo-inositol 2-dehydrogenase/D-chiro-inositol 1-dehydrogenase
MQPDLRKYNDYGSIIGIVEFCNWKIAYYYCSRMMAHGQEDTTEIIDTEANLTVNEAHSKTS